MREGFLEEVTTCRSRQGNGWGNSMCKGPELREEFWVRVGKSSRLWAAEAALRGLDLTLWEWWKHCVWEASSSSRKFSMNPRISLSRLLFGCCSSRAALPPGAPYPASAGSGCQQDQAGLLSPARDKPFLGQAWARAGVSMRQRWRPWECWQV